MGIVLVFLLAWRATSKTFAEGSKAAVAGALLAAMNTATEYGFGGVIASLPGFLAIREALGGDPQCAGARGGHRHLARRHHRLGVRRHVDRAGGDVEGLHRGGERGRHSDGGLHRVAAMASGGMDTLPHNGAVITLLAVTGLTHRESYKDIFAVTILKTAAVFVVIGVYEFTGLY